MNKNEAKQKILNVLKIKKDVAYTHFSTIEEFKGELAQSFINNCYTIIGVNNLFCDAFQELVKEEKLKLEPCSSFIHMADGDPIYKFPIPKRVPKDLEKGFAKEYWIPLIVKMVTNKTTNQKGQINK